MLYIQLLGHMAPCTMHQGKIPQYPLYRRQMDLRVSPNDVEKHQFLTILRLELRFLSRPAYSQSLHGLCYPSPLLM